MTQNYTLNDLVRLIYGETSRSKARALRAEMAYDYELREEYTSLIKAARELPKVAFAPSQGCLDNILRFSKEATLAL